MPGLSFIMHTLLHLEVGPILALSEPCSLTLNLSYNFDRLKLITCVWRQLNTLCFVFLAGLGYGVVVGVTVEPWTKSLFRSHSRVQKNTARVWPNRTEYNSIIDIHSAQKNIHYNRYMNQNSSHLSSSYRRNNHKLKLWTYAIVPVYGRVNNTGNYV